MEKFIRTTVLIGIGFVGAVLLLTQSELGQITIEPLMIKKLTFADGSIYSGQVDELGILSGKGRLRWSNGVEYKGDFKHGLFNGHGTLTTPNSHTYTGAYLDGLEHGIGKISYADGHVYSGELIKGDLEGKGQWTMPDGSVYTGQIKRGGLRHGTGQFADNNGNSYTGGFKDGLMHGQGIYQTSEGDVYSGSFVEDQFTGQGSYTNKLNGAIVGEFNAWVAAGQGIKTDSDGNQWRGVFKDGELNGEGEFIGVDDTHYKGGFRYGRYDGQGVLTDKDENTYKGGFSYGQKHGEGQFEYKDAIDGIKKFSGKWQRGSLVEGDENVFIYSPENISEWAIYNQQNILDKALGRIKQGQPGKPELYVLGIAGWGRQEVFRREIDFIDAQFSRLFGTEDKSIYLVNSQRNIDRRPLATVTSINEAILHIAKKMNKEEDILFIYATSHGSEENGLSLGHSGLVLADLSPAELAKMLEGSGIKHKFVVISACYSGVFVDALKSDTTAVLTAAAADKKSFGCGDNRSFTYFGKAFFAESLESSASFIEAFRNAKSLIAQWEADEDLSPSNPSVHTTQAIEQKMQRWRSTLLQ